MSGMFAAQARNGISLGCLLLLMSCAARPGYIVVPKNPEHVLLTPNSQQVPLSGVLKTYNGFTPGGGWVDLRPMMELRIENAYYQKGFSRRGLAGFLGTETACYRVTSDGLQLISARALEKRPAEDLPSERLIAAAKQHFRFYRLYYEIVFRGNGGSHGSVLLGANSMEELIHLSDELVEPETVCNASSAACTVFPEACTVAVEMDIVVNGKPQTIAWGSKLENIVDEPHRVAMRRLYRGRLVPVRINPRDASDLLLPLLPGDEINWN